MNFIVPDDLRIGTERRNRERRTVVRIADNRRTFTQIDYPKSWKVVGGLSMNIAFDTVAPLTPRSQDRKA